jgi:hypothetical protein
MHPTLIRTSSFILKIASAGFVIAAAYHLLAIFIFLNNSTVWRNLCFILINLWCAFEIRKRKKYFIFLFTILLIQQLISHGSSIIRNIQTGDTNLLNVFVVVSITLIYIALIVSVMGLNKMQSYLIPDGKNEF